MSPSIKKGPKRKPDTCGVCKGEGTLPIDPKDPRKGDRTCWNCHGYGEING